MARADYLFCAAWPGQVPTTSQMVPAIGLPRVAAALPGVLAAEIGETSGIVGITRKMRWLHIVFTGLTSGIQHVIGEPSQGYVGAARLCTWCI